MEINGLVDEFLTIFNSGQPTDHLISTINQNRPLGMDYSDIFHSQRASRLIGRFCNKRVLEMGGALPAEYVSRYLGAKEWVAVESSEYVGNQYNNISYPAYFYDDSGWRGFYNKWKMLNGAVFDVVYSVAAFEHIYDLPGCLQAIYEMLDASGILYAYFTPIWSAPNGSHNFQPAELDCFGKHAHLMFNFETIQTFLVNEHRYSSVDACKTAHSLYKNSQINRYAYEEFMCIFGSSEFSVKNVAPIRCIPFVDIYKTDKLARIQSLYPGMMNSCDGFEIIMRK